MVDYNKKTVAELKEILESRSLAATGKKADLVARLQEADKVAESNAAVKAPTAEATSTPTAPVPAPKPKPAETSAAAATITEPAEAAGGAADAATAAAAGSPSANTDTQLATSANYALGLQASSVDDEMAKRKARAARFGTAVETTETAAAGADGESKEDDAQKAMERAKRFGTGQTAMGKLDEALPMERERGPKKRGRVEETDASMDDPGLIRRGGRGGRGGFRGGRGGRQGSRPRQTGDRPEGVQKAAAYSSDKDRLAAEARKKRFAAAG